MTLTYIFHSGFVMETETSILIFDYWLDPSGVVPLFLKKDKPIFLGNKQRGRYHSDIMPFSHLLSVYPRCLAIFATRHSNCGSL